MIKVIAGLPYEVKSPSLYQLHYSDPRGVVQVGYLGPYSHWGVRVLRSKGGELRRANMTRDDAFKLVSASYIPPRTSNDSHR